MILVNSVPNLKSVAPKLQKLQSCKVSINVAHRRNQPGKTISLVEMKFCRDKKRHRKTHFDAVTRPIIPYPYRLDKPGPRALHLDGPRTS